MISDYFMVGNSNLNTSSGSGISQNGTVVVNGGVSLPSTIPPNTIILNGTSVVLNTQPVVSNPISTISMITSDPERPFVCEICGTRYKSKPGLTYHRQHQHGALSNKAQALQNTNHDLASMSVMTAYNEIMAANGSPAGSVPDAATAAAVAALAASAANSSGNAQPTMQMVMGAPHLTMQPQQQQQQMQDLRPYACEACGMKYKSKPGLNYHRLHVHLENTKNQSMVSESYTELLRTQPGVAGSENTLVLAPGVCSTPGNGANDIERPYTCDVCGAKYKSKPGLAYHRSRTHQEDKPQSYVCPTCGATYKSKPGLAYHKLHAHPELPKR